MLDATDGGMDYEQFIGRKAQLEGMSGFNPVAMPDFLRDFQGSLVEWSILKGRSAIYADCGLGKTPMQLVWADNVVRHANKPVLILAPLAVTHQTLREAEKFGIEARLCMDGKPHRGINITNYEKLHHFDAADFVGAVCDECFAAGTKVDVLGRDGEITQNDIENIRGGDYIVNAAGVDRVSEVHRRSVPYAVKVKIGWRHIIVSPNHPFFTDKGWRGAMDLKPGAKILATTAAMRMVQEGFCPSVCSSRQNQILRSILLSEMADGATGAFGESSHVRGCSEAGAVKVGISQFRNAGGVGGESAIHEHQRDAHAGNPRETLPHIEVEEPRTFRAWGEWSSDDFGSVLFDGCDARELDAGICFITGPIEAGISNALQNRLGEHRAENRNRGGWSLPPIKEGSGSEENGYADFSRVDGVEVLELGHPELDKFRDADGKLYFYDIGATRHPSFSVDGLLVHNSAILKSFDGVRRQEITEFMRKLPYRLLCTATAAPNEYIELGTSSEALGYLGYMDMLTRFFKNNQGNAIRTQVFRQGKKNFQQLDDNAKWRFKGHAEEPFWRWVCGWARAVRKPSDLGFDDAEFILPALHERQHLVDAKTLPDGRLFALPAVGLSEQREERRRTITERCEMAARLVNDTGRAAVVWCHLNDEGDLLERLIPDCVQVSGKDADEAKEEKLMAFVDGKARVLVTKGKIGAWGLNFQHCAHTVAFPTHSFEEYYQQTRRFWRFGQKQEVLAEIVTTEGEKSVLANLQRKAVAADKMFSALVEHMNAGVQVDRSLVMNREEEMPSWL